MAPDTHSSNPFDNPNFRAELSEMFDNKLGDLNKQVDAHEAYINQQKGGGRILHYLWTGLLAIIGGILGGKVR